MEGLSFNTQSSYRLFPGICCHESEDFRHHQKHNHGAVDSFPDHRLAPPYPVHSLLQFLSRKYCNTSDHSQIPADGSISDQRNFSADRSIFIIIVHKIDIITVISKDDIQAGIRKRNLAAYICLTCCLLQLYSSSPARLPILYLQEAVVMVPSSASGVKVIVFPYPE